MKAENRVIDNHCERKIGEYFDDFIPDIVISVFLLNFVVEAVCPGERRRLVVASEQDYRGRLETLED